MGLSATIDELVNYASVADDDALRLANDQRATADNFAGISLWWLARMANTRRPLLEKMTFFWHGLLTSQLSVVRDPDAMLAQNEFFRSHAFSAFPEILRGISQDPAMMVYLDVAGSLRTAPNENYARELMELFSLGEGNYTEQDVREAARAFTGWAVPRQRAGQVGVSLQVPLFRPFQFDNGQKTFLGQTGNFRPDDIVQIIVDQPASARYITRRLFTFFIHPEPTDADLEPFVEVYSQSGYNIGRVVESMLRSDVFYSPMAYRAIVRSPVEYAVAAIKVLGKEATIGQALAQNPQNGLRGGGLLGAMGQTPFEPPNVAGWTGGASWLNSATMFARLNFLNQVTGGAPVVRRPQRGRQPAPAAAQTNTELGTVAEALDYYLPFVLDQNIPAAAQDTLLDYAGGANAKLTTETLRGLVYLLLASPQFHLS